LRSYKKVRDFLDWIKGEFVVKDLGAEEALELTGDFGLAIE